MHSINRNNKGNKMTNEINAIFISRAHKERNAGKAKLSPNAREIYLRGLAKLCNAEALASSGFRCGSYAKAEVSA